MQRGAVLLRTRAPLTGSRYKCLYVFCIIGFSTVHLNYYEHQI